MFWCLIYVLVHSLVRETDASAYIWRQQAFALAPCTLRVVIDRVTRYPTAMLDHILSLWCSTFFCVTPHRFIRLWLALARAGWFSRFEEAKA
jgi:hypothetical protein